MGIAAFPIESDIEALASMLETSRDIDFIKLDKNILVSQQEAGLEEGQDFYEQQPIFISFQRAKRFFIYSFNSRCIQKASSSTRQLYR